MEDKATMELMRDMLNYKKKESKFLFIALVCVIIMNLMEVGAFLWFESQWEYTDTVTTTTTTTEQEVTGDDGNIVNGDQYNDESKNQSGRDK